MDESNAAEGAVSATPWKYDEGFGWIVDAGEGIVCQFWGKAEEPFHNSVENGLLVERAVNAFAALLAVAKAASEDGCCDTSGACEGAESHSATNDALVDLTAAHPGWREWTP